MRNGGRLCRGHRHLAISLPILTVSGSRRRRDGLRAALARRPRPSSVIGSRAMPVHAFVNETKVNGLSVVAAVLQPRDLAAARTAMRRLLLPRQSHLHFVKEKQHASASSSTSSRRSRSASTCTTRPRSRTSAWLARSAWNGSFRISPLKAHTASSSSRTTSAATGRRASTRYDQRCRRPARLRAPQPEEGAAAVDPGCRRVELGEGRLLAQTCSTTRSPGRADLGSEKPGSPTVRKAAGLTSEALLHSA